MVLLWTPPLDRIASLRQIAAQFDRNGGSTVTSYPDGGDREVLVAIDRQGIDCHCGRHLTDFRAETPSDTCDSEVLQVLPG